MTVEAVIPKTIFPSISGIGPYAIGWPYEGTDVVVAVVKDGVRTTLTGSDFSLSPTASDTSGSVFLTSGAAALYVGGQLIVERSTPEEQGWTGIYPGEKGIEAQLDRTTRRIQEMSRQLAGAVRIDGVAGIGSVADGRVLIWDGDKIAPGPTAGEIALAQQYALEAATWAINPEDVPVQSGLFSALHYAAKADQSAADAAQSAATINIPAIPVDGLTFLQSLADQSGYRHRTVQQLREVDLEISGIGSSIASAILDLNTLVVAGEYFASSGATGSPNSEPIIAKHYAADVTTRAVQEAFGLTTGRRWMRVEAADTWGAWVEIPGTGSAGDVTFASAALGHLRRGSPITKTADFAVALNENWLINNKSGSACVVTLPAASSFTGREIMFQNLRDLAVNSASSNVIPLRGGSAGSAILPATNGSWAKLVSDGTAWQIVAQSGGMEFGVAVATTSGSAHDFTGIPSWVREIDIMVESVSLNGTDTLLIQLGISSGFVTSGYNAAVGQVSASSALGNASNVGFPFFGGLAAASTNGVLSLRRLSGNIWVAFGVFNRGDSGAANMSAGRIDLGGTLTQIRLTRTGTNSFDSGSYNIGWR